MDNEHLEKLIWTDADFSTMGWHDSWVHGIGFNSDDYELMLDLDYIFQWVHPEQNQSHFRFRISPVTMVFTDVSESVFDISPVTELEIADISRGETYRTPNSMYEQRRYSIDCQQGQITLAAGGYTMFVKKQPIVKKTQVLEFHERGGINFSRQLI